MQLDAHVEAWRRPLMLFHYELAGGGHVAVVASAGLDMARMEWAVRKMVTMKRGELQREWEATSRVVHPGSQDQ